MEQTNKIADAVKVIIDAMNEDKSEGSFYYSWQANIAMAFVDEMDGYGLIEKSLLHKVANDAAKRFLDLLCR